MEMSNGEIRRSWETAADKKKQIQILAELNCTDERTIRDILIMEGVDQRRLPRNRQHAEPKAVSFAKTVGESLGQGIEAGLQTPDPAIAEKVSEATAKLGVSLARAGRSAEAATKALRDLDDVLDAEAEKTTDEAMAAITAAREHLPGVVKLYNRPKVEPRRDYERRRLVELFEAIITTEQAGEEVELDWVTEFNSRWVEYVTEHYMEATAE